MGAPVVPDLAGLRAVVYTPSARTTVSPGRTLVLMTSSVAGVARYSAPKRGRVQQHTVSRLIARRMIMLDAGPEIDRDTRRMVAAHGGTLVTRRKFNFNINR